MSLPAEYLAYPRRRRGMDHDRYGYSPVPARRPPVEWPNGARVALWIVPALEFFPLDMDGRPFRAPGAMERPYPDYWNYTLRDYGNRVGVFRVFQALDALGLKASVAINARLAERTPFMAPIVAASSPSIARLYVTDCWKAEVVTPRSSSRVYPPSDEAGSPAAAALIRSS